MNFIGAFEIHDIFTVFTLALLEGILSVDNALVLAILVRPLPVEMRKRALRLGIIGAFVFRILALIFATYLVQYSIFKFVGGVYLIYLAVKHMFFGLMDGHEQKKEVSSAQAFWKIVLLVELTDIVFSIDSITTAVAFSDKLWVLWFGGICGIILMRFLSSVFVKALEKYPKLEDLAYQLVFFVGVKLSFETLGVHIEKGVFWLMMGVIMFIGVSLIVKDRQLHNDSLKKGNLLLDEIKSGKRSLEEVFNEEKLNGEVLRWLYNEGYLKVSKE